MAEAPKENSRIGAEEDDAAGINAQTWVLVAQYPGNPEIGLTHGITAVRQVDRQEFEAIEDALKKFGDYGQSWDWSTIQLSIKTFHEELLSASSAFGKARAVNKNDAEQLSRSFADILSRVEQWISCIESETQAIDGRVTATRAAEVAQYLSSNEPIQIMRELAKTGDKTRVELVETNVVPPTLVPTLRLESDGHESKIIRIDALLEAAVPLLEVVGANDLIGSRDSLTAAARRFASLGAEALGGFPALLPQANLASASKSVRSQLPFTMIPANQVPSIMNALRSAERIAQEYAQFRAGVGQRSERGAGDSAMATRPAVTRDASEKARPSSTSFKTAHDFENGVSTAEDAPLVGPETIEESNVVTDGRSLSADVAGLESAILQAKQLSQNIEVAWSNALKSTREWHTEAFGQWASIIGILQNIVVSHSKALELRGLHTRLPGMPLPPDAADKFVVSPDGQQGITQLLVAQTDSLQHLLRAMKGLQEPTAYKLDLVSGRTQTWWEAGAFGAISDLAEVVIQTTRELDVLVSPTKQEHSHRAMRGFLDDLGAANTCILRGLHEPAIIYLNRSIISLEKLNPPWLAGQVTRLQGQSRESLSEAAKLISSGNEVSRGYVIPIAHFWAGVLGDIVRVRLHGLSSMGAKGE